MELLPEVADAIVEHALAGYPEEVCGLIAGNQGTGRFIYKGKNVSPTPRVAFEMDSDTLMRQIDLEEEGLELVAIYHSHPAGPGGPSASDVAYAFYPQAATVICSLAGGRPALRAFRIAGGTVDEVQLTGFDLSQTLDKSRNSR